LSRENVPREAGAILRPSSLSTPHGGHPLQRTTPPKRRNLENHIRAWPRSARQERKGRWVGLGPCGQRPGGTVPCRFSRWWSFSGLGGGPLIFGRPSSSLPGKKNRNPSTTFTRFHAPWAVKWWFFGGLGSTTEKGLRSFCF